LTDKGINDNEYRHACKVFDCLEDKTLGGYCEYYLTTDVLLLQDVFQAFRQTCVKNFGLDPTYYISGPSFSYDAMLRHTKAHIELMTDINMINLVRASIRGGLVMSVLKYSEANNKYMNKFNPAMPKSMIMFLDCVNLYGHAMTSNKYPCSDYRFLENDDFDYVTWNIQIIYTIFIQICLFSARKQKWEMFLSF
jgi:DNA polymerase type B, organellar and viral